VPQAAAGVLTMDAALREKVARAARWNGGSILVIAGLSAVFSLVGAELMPTLFGAAIAAAGWAEHAAGRRLALADADVAALRTRLVRCELAVLALILGYSAWRLGSADFAAELAALPDDERMLVESLTGGDRELLEQMFASALKLTYCTLMIVTLLYQGGMAWWYDRRLGSPA
jgi:thiosulfate reductase cytochrome b subunit